MGKLLYAVSNLCHTYTQSCVSVLKNLYFQINPGEMVALMGPSGAGKSTLLHIAGLLEDPTSGEIFINNRSVKTLTDSEKTRKRREFLGFVYQFHHLLPEFSAVENVILPQRLKGTASHRAYEKACELLSLVGVEHRMHHRPSRLSGGEQQRIALARAMANDPQLLIADEPTGNLDEKTGNLIFELMKNLARSKGTAILMATHNTNLAQRMDRIMILKDGHLGGNL